MSAPHEVRLVAVSPKGISTYYTGQRDLEACHEYLIKQLALDGDDDPEAIPFVADLAE
jgi:hypothetical protein